MGDDETGHCHYFKKQPETPEELVRAIEAVNVSCCGALVYSGNAPYVIRELCRRGCHDQIVGSDK